MKRFILVLSALLVSLYANAQWGVVAGVADPVTNLDDAAMTYRSITQYNAGLTGRLDLGLLAIQPSLICNFKGSSVEKVLEGESLSAGAKTYYLELPLQLQLNLLRLGTTLNAYAIAEPFAGYALYGEANENNAGWKGMDWNNLNRLDFGVGLGAGALIFKHVQASLVWRWRMGKLVNGNGEFDHNFKEIVETLQESSSNELRLSVAFLF